MKNEFGIELDRAGYAPSIMQDGACCALCGKCTGKLDRHEPWGGTANRQKSKALGMWVLLCHDSCHQGRGGVHDDPALNLRFRQEAQLAAMARYGWDKAEFIRRFGKSALAEEDNAADAAGGWAPARAQQSGSREESGAETVFGFALLPDLVLPF